MAIAGGATSAYGCMLRDGKLAVLSKLTMLRSECDRVDEAVIRLQAGEVVTVAGGDMEPLRARLAALQAAERAG